MQNYKESDNIFRTIFNQELIKYIELFFQDVYKVKD